MPTTILFDDHDTTILYIGILRVNNIPSLVGGGLLLVVDIVPNSLASSKRRRSVTYSSIEKSLFVSFIVLMNDNDDKENRKEITGIWNYYILSSIILSCYSVV